MLPRGWGRWWRSCAFVMHWAVDAVRKTAFLGVTAGAPVHGDLARLVAGQVLRRGHWLLLRWVPLPEPLPSSHLSA